METNQILIIFLLFLIVINLGLSISLLIKTKRTKDNYTDDEWK
jgi:hypothetical protein